jgi:uncharacterized membrane protein
LPGAGFGGSAENVAMAKRTLLWFLILLYTTAGVLHIVMPSPFLSITPAWVPLPSVVVFATGVCEILGAIGLVMPRFRRVSAICLAIYAVAVYPANINHAMMDIASAQPALGLWYHIPRLLFQPFLVWTPLFVSRHSMNQP